MRRDGRAVMWDHETALLVLTAVLVIANLLTAVAALMNAKVARREFALTKKPWVVIDGWDIKPFEKDGKPHVSLSATIRAVGSVPVTVHEMRYRTQTSSLPMMPSEYRTTVGSGHPVLLYGDSLVSHRHFGECAVPDPLVVAGGMAVIAVAEVECKFSAEGDTHFETWWISFHVIAINNQYQVLSIPPLQIGRGRRPGAWRKKWQRWKREMGLLE